MPWLLVTDLLVTDLLVTDVLVTDLLVTDVLVTDLLVTDVLVTDLLVTELVHGSCVHCCMLSQFRVSSCSACLMKCSCSGRPLETKRLGESHLLITNVS